MRCVCSRNASEIIHIRYYDRIPTKNRFSNQKFIKFDIHQNAAILPTLIDSGTLIRACLEGRFEKAQISHHIYDQQPAPINIRFQFQWIVSLIS